MFSSSVRRAALSTPPPPISSALASAIPRAATQTLSRRHQRRASSSKPSSPANGSKKIAEDEAVAAAATKSSESSAAAATKPSSSKASSSSSGRKKGGAGKPGDKRGDDSFAHLPSVPSTQHITPAQLGASAFFALHRPMSLTTSFPRTVTDEAFAAIFTPRTKSVRPGEVINTLSSTLKTLNNITGQMEMVKLGKDQWNESDDIRASITAESYQKEMDHLDGVAEDSGLPYLLSNKHQPFNPPPPPQPLNTPESLIAGAEAADSLEPQHRTYTTVVTIEETTDLFGDVTYSASHSPLISEDPAPVRPQKFLERMHIRQEQYRINHPEQTGMLAISVKRLRKLKMKKHKYKKLMKRTRNLRRRLDRI